MLGGTAGTHHSCLQHLTLFKEEVAQGEVQEVQGAPSHKGTEPYLQVFVRHRAALNSIFTHYASSGDPSDGNPDSMNV